MASNNRSYLITFFGSFFLLIIVSVIINTVAFHKRIIINENIKENIQPALMLESILPNGVIIGTSRTSVFKQVVDWPSTYKPWMVFTNRADPPACTLKRLQNILYYSPGIKKVLLCPDFFVFNAYNHGYKQFCDISYMSFPLPENYFKRLLHIWEFKVKRYFYFIFSVQNTWSNTQALWSFFVKKPLPNEYWDQSMVTYANKFKYNEIFYLRETLWPGANKVFDYNYLESQRTTLDEFRETLALLYESNIEVDILILPHHVRIHEITTAAGLDHEYKQWLRTITSINNDIANLKNKQPYSILNFALYNEYTTEIAYDDLSKPMIYYSDASHFSPQLATKVIDYLFGQDKADFPENFCLEITPKNIDRFIHDFEVSQKAFRKNHPEVTALMQSHYENWEKAKSLWYKRPMVHKKYWE